MIANNIITLDKNELVYGIKEGILLDKRIIAVLSIFILATAVIPAFQATNATTSEITKYSNDNPAVDAAYKGYVGSIKSNVYHKPKCRYVKKIKSYNKIYFKTKAKARKRGYRACKVCRP